jgi:tyrosyl-tRNA synthetase
MGTAVDFVAELRWRGMVHNMTAGAEQRLAHGMVTGYAGFDPTAPSLQVGNLAAIMLLVHFQRAGHKPLALVGGATGMVGDPSGKSEERPLMTPDEIQHNLERFKTQLQRFLDFGQGANGAEIVNNYDWFAQMRFLDFLRDIGKHLTVSYMMAKDSVQSRLEAGISFTEFSYQLLQGYDFYWLYKKKNCVLQMGGSDQWGNITAGTELIRRKARGEAYALTCPLVTRADGTKFGKSAAGEKLWLDPEMTSPYRFYQFWLNCSDADAARFLRVFTLLSADEIEALEQQHEQTPHQRPLQKALAHDITVRVHSEDEYRSAVNASRILFGKATTEALRELPEKSFLDVFEGVPRATIDRDRIARGISLTELLSEESGFFGSKGEVRRLLRSGGLSVNKEKTVDENATVTPEMLIKGKYVLVQKGKKNYYLIIAQ